MKKLFIIIIIFFITGCKNETKELRLFFNPSHSQDLRKFNFSVIFNGKLLLDTVLTNDYIDKSHLLKGFHFNGSENVILIKINTKTKKIRIPTEIKNCLDIFTFYDDHSIVNDIASGIEKVRINKGMIADYKMIVDSIRKSKVNYYDEIQVNIKHAKCE